MKKLAAAILLMLLFGSSALSAQSTQVEIPVIGISFVLPDGWSSMEVPEDFTQEGMLYAATDETNEYGLVVESIGKTLPSIEVLHSFVKLYYGYDAEILFLEDIEYVRFVAPESNFVYLMMLSQGRVYALEFFPATEETLLADTMLKILLSITAISFQTE